MTNFWLHNLEPVTEYFLQVRAQASYGKKKLLGKKASIVFQTTNQSRGKKLGFKIKSIDLRN